jgi:hypothetical protein
MSAGGSAISAGAPPPAIAPGAIGVAGAPVRGAGMSRTTPNANPPSLDRCGFTPRIPVGTSSRQACDPVRIAAGGCRCMSRT